MELTFGQFQALMLAAGYEEVIERVWAPNTRLEEHAHPFEANGIVVSGIVDLQIEGEPTRRLNPGDTYHVFAGIRHAEVYGEHGATVWAARKNQIPSAAENKNN
jgi:quercetin dioxygenase-like cupin family protein